MADDDDRILICTVPKGLFDPPDRPLTAEEKAHPMTFFGVTYEMRMERLAAAGQLPPKDWDADAKPKPQAMRPMEYFKKRDRDNDRDR